MSKKHLFGFGQMLFCRLGLTVFTDADKMCTKQLFGSIFAP